MTPEDGEDGGARDRIQHVLRALEGERRAAAQSHIQKFEGEKAMVLASEAFGIKIARHYVLQYLDGEEPEELDTERYDVFADFAEALENADEVVKGEEEIGAHRPEVR